MQNRCIFSCSKRNRKQPGYSDLRQRMPLFGAVYFLFFFRWSWRAVMYMGFLPTGEVQGHWFRLPDLQMACVLLRWNSRKRDRYLVSDARFLRLLVRWFCMEFFQAGCWDLFTGYFKFAGIYVDKIHVKDTSEVSIYWKFNVQIPESLYGSKITSSDTAFLKKWYL